jgi:hypothetical protein
MSTKLVITMEVDLPDVLDGITPEDAQSIAIVPRSIVVWGASPEGRSMKVPVVRKSVELVQ